MNEEKTKLEKGELEDVSGGYGIIHRHDGYKTLVDDNGKRVDIKFNDTFRANDFAKDYERAFDNASGSLRQLKDFSFKKGKEWEEY